jgi:hypothetical protein
VRDLAVPVCPTIRDMRQHDSGVCTRQISFTRDHIVSQFYNQPSETSFVCLSHYAWGNPHVIWSPAHGLHTCF